MSKSLIRKNQFHPDIADLITGVSDEFFYKKSQAQNDLQQISGNFVNKFGNESITGSKNFVSRPTVNNIPVLLSGEANLGGGDGENVLFNGERAITANVIGFQNINPNTTNVAEFLDKVFYPFVSASASLNSYDIREFGGSANTLSVAGSISPGSENKINSIIYQTGFNGAYQNIFTEGLQNIKNSFSYSSNSIIFKTTDFRVVIQFPNSGATPSPLNITRNQISRYEAPYYYGVSNLTVLNSSQVTSLTKGPIVQSPGSVTHTFSPINQYIYIACPNDGTFDLTPWGLITKVRDLNTNFEYTNDLNSPQTLQVTIGAGRVVTYRVYRWANLVNGGSFQLQFTF
jgi:hypothetical protein